MNEISDKERCLADLRMIPNPDEVSVWSEYGRDNQSATDLICEIEADSREGKAFVRYHAQCMEHGRAMAYAPLFSPKGYQSPTPEKFRWSDWVNPISLIAAGLAIAGIIGGAGLIGTLSPLALLVVLLALTIGGSLITLIFLSWKYPSPCVAGSMIFLIWWGPFLAGCWIGTIGRLIFR